MSDKYETEQNKNPVVADTTGLLLGAPGRTRTDDLLITNQLLYQLSYGSAFRNLLTSDSIQQNTQCVNQKFSQVHGVMARGYGAPPFHPLPSFAKRVAPQSRVFFSVGQRSPSARRCTRPQARVIFIPLPCRGAQTAPAGERCSPLQMRGFRRVGFPCPTAFPTVSQGVCFNLCFSRLRREKHIKRHARPIPLLWRGAAKRRGGFPRRTGSYSCFDSRSTASSFVEAELMFFRPLMANIALTMIFFMPSIPTTAPYFT